MSVKTEVPSEVTPEVTPEVKEEKKPEVKEEKKPEEKKEAAKAPEEIWRHHEERLKRLEDKPAPGLMARIAAWLDEEVK